MPIDPDRDDPAGEEEPVALVDPVAPVDVEPGEVDDVEPGDVADVEPVPVAPLPPGLLVLPVELLLEEAESSRPVMRTS